MSKPNPQVDAYIKQSPNWSAEMGRLRTIVLDCHLTEEIKWRVPCYTFEGNNVVIISELKDCATLSFMKGALLKDSSGILAIPGENTQSARYIRFQSVQEIAELEPTVRAYIQEAIEVEKAGLKVEFKQIDEFEIPAELQAKLDELPDLKTAFENLTPGRQRAYLMHFASAKQAKTREARVEKCIPRILKGMGLNDW